MSIVSPPKKVDHQWVAPVKQLNAGWVAVMPYAFGQAGVPSLRYNAQSQWWGEQFEGIQTIVQHARKEGLKVMLKPMVWVQGSWAGGFDLEDEAQWKQWEANYRAYTLAVTKIAVAEKVEMICLGTELKVAVRKRAKFFRALIDEVRLIYPGKLTYAANWDDYFSVNLWDKLDYIGVDAYFPLSPTNAPTVQELKIAWLDPLRKISQLYKVYRKPILFTEFGYRSIDQCCWEQWLRENLPHDAYVNLQNQENAYKAFFESFWHQPWFAGVFLWQWYTHHDLAGGNKNSDFTPQNKPAERLIAEWFAKPAPEQSSSQP
ncbi:MAG TPA: hypothetical protein VHS96_10140 [Bacteroidia bacterium]|nr:hypothetical protein [Bacteroidia bacterium]